MKQLNGMSQQEFANQIGISQDKVSRIENDPSQVSVKILLRIAAHFGMSLDKLIKVPKPKIPAMRVDYTWSSARATAMPIRMGSTQAVCGKPLLHSPQ